MNNSTIRLIVAAAFFALAALAFGPGTTHAGGNALLYDLDFGSPPHTVGLPPVVGGGPPPRDTVSSINFGTPTVVASLGLLGDQPLQFDSFDNQGDQIELHLFDLPPSSFYVLECEVLVMTQASNADFAILFDTPQIRTIRFAFGGNVNIFVPGVSSQSIGTFALGAIVDLRVEVNLAADTWTIFLDNVLAHTGGFGGATQINDVRFSSPVVPNPAGILAGLDNVRIGETAPVAVESTSWSQIKTLYR
jgi:hypothetical protein